MKLSVQTIIWSFVLLDLLVAATMAFLPKPVEVESAKVIRGDLLISVVEDGKTRIREKYIVSTPVSGRLSRVELNPGDEICDGHSRIAVFTPAEPTMLDARSKAQAEARVEQAEAALNRAVAAAEQVQVTYTLSKSKFERAEKLFPNRAISQDEYDVAKSDFLAKTHAVRTVKFDEEIAKYELEMAKAALLQFADTNGDQANAIPFEIFAPVGGKVLRVFQESSTIINVGMPLIEMGDPNNLEIEIDVLSTDAVQIKSGADLTIEHWGGGSPLKGVVRVVEPAAFTKISSLGVEEQRVNIIADFNESPERLTTLGDGYRVEARITIDDIKDIVQVPNSALFRYERDWHVFAIEGDRAQLRPVEIGAQNESHTQILNGLTEADEVILYPSDSVSSDTSIVRTE